MKKLLNSCRKTLSQLSKMFLRVQATFSRFFCEKCANFICPFCILIDSASFSAEFSQAGLAKLHSRCQRIFSRKNNWCLIFFQFINRFRIWAKIFRFYGKNCAAALSKVHFFRQGNKTKENLFWKNVSIFNNFLTSGWIVPDPQWHFSKVLSKSKFLFPMKYFGLKYVFEAKKSSSRF